MKQFVAGVAVGIVGALALFPAVKAASQADYTSLSLFAEAIERVNANYVHKIEVSELVDKALHGMMSALDPHSSYLNAKELAPIASNTANEGAGVGLELTVEYGRTKVITPIDNSPAALGDIRPGDFILDIDGQGIDGLPLYDVTAKLRGPENSKVVLTVQRQFGQKPFDVTLTRNVVKNSSVKYARKNDIGYVRISAFNENTDSALKNAVADLKKQIGPNLKGYIIDLRNDPGGLLDQAIVISNAFLERGRIVSTSGRSPQDNNAYDASPGDITDGKPLVVLINEGTASGAEIVAGALQDNQRATIVGMKSFGMGTIQTVIPLKDGALRLTTAEFYRPSGGEIQTIGITPDVAVAQLAANDDSGTAAYATSTTSEAQLPGHFPAVSQSNQTSSSVIYPDKKYDDFQLSYALDRMNGQQAAPKK